MSASSANVPDASSDASPSGGLIALVKEGFAAYKEDHQQQMGGAEIPLQQLLMPIVMGFAGGNWAFMDTVLPHVAQHVNTYVVNTVGNGDVHYGAKQIGEDVSAKVDAMLRSSGLDSTLSTMCIAGADPVAATVFNIGLLIEQLLVLAVHLSTNNPQGLLFSNEAKKVVVNFSGGWLEQIAGQLTSGRAGIMAFLQTVSSVITPRVVALFPAEISMYTMFATPLVMNMLIQFHQQFVKEKEADEAGLYA